MHLYSFNSNILNLSVFRDIKLENIMIACNSRSPYIKLTDFGLAKFDFTGDSLRNGAGSMPYLSPEVVKKERYGRPVDVWAVGVVTYALLCGTLPFGNDEATKERILNGSYNFDGPKWRHVSPVAQSFIKSLLEPNPYSRPTAGRALEHPWFRLQASMLTSSHSSPAYSSSSFLSSAADNLADFQQRQIIDLLAVDSVHSEELDLTDIDYEEEYEKCLQVRSTSKRRTNKRDRSNHSDSSLSPRP